MSPTFLRASFCVLLLVAASISTGCGKKDEGFKYQVHTVRRGDLRIYVRQKGAIEARDPQNIVCPIEGSTTILDLIPEGTRVAKGDKVCTFDVSDRRDKLLQQEIDVTQATEAVNKAEKDVEIQKQQNASDIRQAELNVFFAELDIRQYKEGELPTSQKTSQAEIALATTETKTLEDKLSWSQKLVEKGYISKDRFESDKLSVDRSRLDVTVAGDRLSLLNNFTAVKRVKELESKYEEAKSELLRTKTKAEAALSQAEGQHKATVQKLELERAKKKRLEEQVKNHTLFAPRDGIVVYGRQGGGGRDSRPMEIGAKVNEGTVVATIPDMDKVLVDVDIHESMVNNVRLGMPVIITTDVGQTLSGVVESIATIPDSQSWYRNPDLKVYSSKVTIDNTDGKLKPGMNCQAEVIIEEIKGTLSLPVQSVFENGEKAFCYLNEGGKAKLTEIEVGRHNGEMIVVTKGISEGQEVFLAVPPDSEPIPPRRAREAPSPSALPMPSPTAAPQGGPANGGPPGGRRPGGGQGGQGRGGMSEEMRKQFESMTPEQREEAMKKFREGRGRGQGGNGQGQGDNR